MVTPELEVLKPIDASITDSDDYEIFVLSNAHVVYESHAKPASLLAAYTHTPLRVEGRLEAPDRAQVKCCMSIWPSCIWPRLAMTACQIVLANLAQCSKDDTTLPT